MNTNPHLLKAFIAEQLRHGAEVAWDTDDIMPKDGPIVMKLTYQWRSILIVQYIEGGTVVGWEIYIPIFVPSPADVLKLDAAKLYLLGWPT